MIHTVLPRRTLLRRAILGLALVTLATPPAAAAQFGNNFGCLKIDPHDNAELQQLIHDDQALRRGAQNVPADATRLARVLVLYHADSIRTAADFANASLILQHGRQPEHYLLAHEFTTLAVGLGCGEGFGGFMLPATEYRLLYSFGLNPAILQDATQSGLDLSSGMQIRTYPLSSFQLTEALLTEVSNLRHQLKLLQSQHPESFQPSTPLDTLAAVVARTPALAAIVFAHLTPQQWRSFEEATRTAIENAFFAPIAPRPMAPVTGALRWSPMDADNIDFVLTHRAALEQVGYEIHLITDTPVASELARAHLEPVVLPPDVRATAWSDSCPSGGQDTVTDNPELLHLVAERSHSGSAAMSSSAAAGRSRVLVLLQQHALRTPRDHLRAASILEQGGTPEDALRAHNLAVTEVGVCGSPALQLAAASEDRFLALLGLKQRFGTLPHTVAPVDTGPAAVTDGVRHLLALPPVRLEAPR